MISSLFNKNRATNTKMHAPHPLGLKSFVTENADYQNQVVSRPVPEVQNALIEDEDEDEQVEEEEEEDNACWASYGRGQRRKFPPPLPLLARTGNLSCHMPWVLQRTYRSDGSLVIKEVRVRHHEYFRARREKGRLTLQLVELDENCDLFESGQCNDSTIVEAMEESKESTVAPRFTASPSTFPAVTKNKGCTSHWRGMTSTSRVRAVNV